MKYLLTLWCVLMLSGCSWMKFWESDDSDEVSLEPAKLERFQKEVNVRKKWSSGGLGDAGRAGGVLRPAMSGTAIFAADSDGDVIALNRDNGKRLWRTRLKADLSGGVGYAAGRVMVGSFKGELYVLAADSGDLLWRANVGTEILAAPSGNDEIIVVQTQEGRLQAFNAASGQSVWQFQIDLPVLTVRGTCSPLVTDNLVAAGFANGKVYGFSPAQGSVLWESRVAIPSGRTDLERVVDVDGELLLVDDLLYAVSYQGRATAISRGNGRNLWYQDSSSHNGVAHGLSQIYIAEVDGTLKALRANSGQLLWSNEKLSYRGLNQPAVAGGYLAVADQEGYLHVLSQTDGNFVGRTKVDGSGVSVPMLSDGDTLYVQDNDGGLKAYIFEQDD